MLQANLEASALPRRMEMHTAGAVMTIPVLLWENLRVGTRHFKHQKKIICFLLFFDAIGKITKIYESTGLVKKIKIANVNYQYFRSVINISGRCFKGIESVFVSIGSVAVSNGFVM